MSLDSCRFTIVGAGLVGSLLAGLLARRGAQVEVIEKRADLRRHDIKGGRTIAMSLSDRGWHALAAAGIDDRIRAASHPKRARCVHLDGGELLSQPYGGPDQALWTVNRKRLNCDLMDHAEATGRVAFRHQTECKVVDLAQRELQLQGPDGIVTTEPFEHLIGADGMNSRVRAALRDLGVLSDEVATIDYRYFELTVPPAADDAWRLPADCVHVWPRSEGLMVALPNAGGAFTGTFFHRAAAGHPFGAGVGDAERATALRRILPDVAALVADVDREIAANPTSAIRTVRCRPWHLDDRALLIGDAAHAIVPFYAMGMNVGFEDCSVFAAILDQTGGDVGAAFARFSAERRGDTDAISDLSLRNFSAIGNSADPTYHRRWHLERALWTLFPDLWTPLYVMIHFDQRPLREVVRRQAAQASVLQALIAEFPADADDDPARLRAYAAPRVRRMHAEQSVA